MNGFIIKTADQRVIRFRYYEAAAVQTVAAFERALPFMRTFLHARVSGQEIWIDNAPRLDVAQENVSVYTSPGEVVIGPIQPSRNKIAGCMGIFYGEGKLLDGGNIFAKVFEEDFTQLEELGNRIWKSGGVELTFERLS